MGEALAQARRAEECGEVPIGAVIVAGGELLGRGHNQTRKRCDPTAHAEVLAVRIAARNSGYQRLDGATVYSTVEPCFMCAGALIHARVARVVWAIRDPKFGGCASLGQVLELEGANHRATWAEGLMAQEARSLMQDFFRRLRKLPKETL
ncbi:MAG: tRNA(adenine34) deaminase [Planctomycetota bacterium]|jgi:tRNA(adenine34) deaminase